MAVDSSGNLYVDSILNNNVEEIAATNHTQWGMAMTAGDAYIIAGSSSGSYGDTGNGGAATSALLNSPVGLAVDAAGDLYIADGSNNRIQEVAATTGTQWGQSMTAGDIYTVAGSSSGISGYSGDGGAATSAELTSPAGIAVDSSGDLLICDSNDSAVREVAKSSGTHWGQSMTANDIYTIAGGNYGDSGDGGAATSADMIGPNGIALDAAGDLYIADAGNNRVQEVPLSSAPNGANR